MWCSRLHVFLAQVPGALLQPGKLGICQWPSFCQETLRNPYADASMPWCHRSTLVPNVQQRFSNTIPAQSLLKKTQQPRLVTYTALNCFTVKYYDVKHPLACFVGIVHARVTQTRPIDVSRIQRTSCMPPPLSGLWIPMEHATPAPADRAKCESIRVQNKILLITNRNDYPLVSKAVIAAAL